MYYNRILRVWVLDQLDYFLLSALLGSIMASALKEYLSEKAARERLKNSIIKKSTLVRSKPPIFNSKKTKIKKIYKFALNNRGGQFEEFEAQQEFSNESFKLAQKIRAIVEQLASFLKERELRGFLKIFFKGGRLILELIFYKCNINITFLILNKQLSTHVIVLTATVGGAAGFTISWFSVGVSLFLPPLLISVLLLRSFSQQVLNQREYFNFKRMINKMLDDDELKETIRASFIKGEVKGLEMKPLDFDKNPALKYNFDSKSGKHFEEFIKSRMENALGLIENPTKTQLEEIIHRKGKIKSKGKTVFFRDFIDAEGADLLDTDLIDEIINAEILEEPIRIKLDNEL
nr:hypothetical protein [Naviculales sp.]